MVRLSTGLRRYLFALIDPHHAAVSPLRQRREFQGHFQQRLDAHGSTHWWTYPRSPKMNAPVERFNRTLQETFVDYHEDLLFDDLVAFNRKLVDWLLAYNTVLPSIALGVNLRYNSSFNVNPSVKGGGPIRHKPHRGAWPLSSCRRDRSRMAEMWAHLRLGS